MSNLELTVEALKRCVPKEAFDKAMAELATLTPLVQLKRVRRK